RRHLRRRRRRGRRVDRRRPQPCRDRLRRPTRRPGGPDRRTAGQHPRRPPHPRPGPTPHRRPLTHRPPTGRPHPHHGGGATTLLEDPDPVNLTLITGRPTVLDVGPWIDTGALLVHPWEATPADWLEADVVVCDVLEADVLWLRHGPRTGPLFLIGVGRDDAK